MFTTAIDKPIPTYPFEVDEATGNAMFRINKSDCIANYRKSDFLIPHRKGYYFMAFVRNGTSRHWIDLKPYVLEANSFYFTVPQQVHLKEESKTFSGTTLSFTSDFLAFDDTGLLNQLPLILNPKNGHQLRLGADELRYLESLLDLIHDEYHSDGAWQNNMLFAYMKVLLIYLSRLYTVQYDKAEEEIADTQVLKKFTRLVNESFTDHHEVSEYAQMMNISAGHLGELVKTQSGKPAIAHIHERLIMEARRLLFHTEYPIKQVAFDLGFEDASYFNRFFKRLTNTTPLDYRTKIREMYH